MRRLSSQGSSRPLSVSTASRTVEADDESASTSAPSNNQTDRTTTQNHNRPHSNTRSFMRRRWAAADTEKTHTQTPTEALASPQTKKQPAASVDAEALPGRPRSVSTPAERIRSSSTDSSKSPKGPRLHPDMRAMYSVGEVLGSGAFGTVWAGTHRETREKVAIKIVDRQRQLVEDFRLEPAEAEILKKLSHPNIVMLLDYVASDSSLYLVMELVTGGHLQSRLAAIGHYTDADAWPLFAQVVSAVHHLHEHGITHRDIKPENLLFDGEHEGATLKLTDFGLSTMKEGRLTTRCGTPSYCAPELLGGEGYGKAVDMWSLGVLAYVMLTGKLPFAGRDRDELFKTIRRGRFYFPTGFSVPALAQDLIHRLLRLEPMKRYSTRETLQHPWVTGGQAAADSEGLEELSLGLSEESSEISMPPVCVQSSLDTVHEMMRRFNAERRLRCAINAIRACVRLQMAIGMKLPSMTVDLARLSISEAVDFGLPARPCPIDDMLGEFILNEDEWSASPTSESRNVAPTPMGSRQTSPVLRGVNISRSPEKRLSPSTSVPTSRGSRTETARGISRSPKNPSPPVSRGGFSRRSSVGSVSANQGERRSSIASGTVGERRSSVTSGTVGERRSSVASASTRRSSLAVDVAAAGALRQREEPSPDGG